MTTPNPFAGDIKDLRADADRLKTERATKYAEAEKLATETKASNPDVAKENGPEFAAIVEAYKAADVLGSELASIQDQIVTLIGMAGTEVASETPAKVSATGTLGERFAASREYQAALAAGAFDGSGRVDFGRIQLASRPELRQMFKAATVDLGATITPDSQLFPVTGLVRRAPRVLDLITIAETSSSAVDYLIQGTRTGAAAAVAPGTSSAELGGTWTKETANVKRIAAHMPVLKSQLADEPRMRTELNTEISGAIVLTTENQALGGDGLGENLLGISSTVGIGSVAKATLTIHDAVHQAMTTVRVALEDDLSAIGMHPNDYHRFTTAKDSAGNYLTTRGPNEPEAATLWGYPVVVSTAFTEGVAMVGRWNWAYLWVRSALTVESGYIGDQFVQDTMTLAGEYRAAFAVKRPEAFAEVTGLNL